MKHPQTIFRLSLLWIFSCALVAISHGALVSVESAKASAAKWLDGRTAFKLSPTAKVSANSTVRTVRNAAKTTLFHVVKMDGGGFIVVAADDRITPVVAFSENGELVEDERNPLWTMLNRDMPKRLALANSMAIGKKSAGQSFFAGKTSATISKTGTSSVDDMRVRPILKSKWDQDYVGSKTVYNYHTPNNWVCGCVATAAAQVMRYHEFPTSVVAKVDYQCEVGGRSTTLTTIGGVYNWSLMPLVPDSTISDAEREMIGRLTYDAGVASCMDYSSGGSGTIGYYTEKALKSLFHYRQAVFAEQFSTSIGVMGQVENALLANLDAGCPVMMGISGKDVATRKNVGHEIVGDGYGYIGDTLYVHLNLGWSGSWDAWYNLPNIDTYVGREGCDFDLFDDIVYNIFPDDSLEIVSGRVQSSSGIPIEGAIVRATDADGRQVAEATTSEFGVYALKVPPNGTFTIHANVDTLSGEPFAVQTGESSTYSTYFKETHASSFASSVGNRWGNDITINAGTCVTPAFSRESCSFVDSIHVGCDQPDAEATIRYTLDGTEPTASSAKWPASGLTLRRTTTVKARTFRSGMTDSPVASVTFVDRPTATISGGNLSWGESVGASYYRVYRSSNRFGTELEACSPWMAATSFQTQEPSSASETCFYFVRAAAEPDDDFGSPLSDAVARTTSQDPDTGADTQVFTFVDVGGATNTTFLITDFPVLIPDVHYTTAGAFGGNGFFKVNVPTTSRKNISIPENAADGTIKTTMVSSSSKFGEANGTVFMGSNSGGSAPRAWRASLYFVKGGVTNYVAHDALSASPVCFHYFQQCPPNPALEKGSVSVAGNATNGVLRVTCAREYEWDAVSDSPWLTLVRTHGRGSCAVRFAADANPGDQARTGTITVSCGTERMTFAVNQGVQGGDEPPSPPPIQDEICATASQGTKTSSVFLRWNAIEGAASYEIYRSDSAEEMQTLPYWTSGNQIPAFIDFGIQPGTAYFYRVVAVKADGRRTAPSPVVAGWAATSVSSDKTSVAFDATGGVTRIVVESNAGWKASTDVEWLALDAIDTERNGMLDVSADENRDASPRTATITVVGGSNTAHPSTNVIVVTQSAAVLSGTGREGGRSVSDGHGASENAVSADPTVRAVIEVRNGSPHVTWISDLTSEEQEKRVYTIWGKESLDSAVQWKKIDTLDEESARAMRFFRVTATWK